MTENEGESEMESVIHMRGRSVMKDEKEEKR